MEVWEPWLLKGLVLENNVMVAKDSLWWPAQDFADNDIELLLISILYRWHITVVHTDRVM